MSAVNESTLELAALDWLAEIGFRTAYGPDLAPGGSDPERESLTDVLLRQRLLEALTRMNPSIPYDGIEDAQRKLTTLDGTTLISRNRQVHQWLRDGVEVEYRRADGSVAGDLVQVLDSAVPSNNDFLAVNQMVVREGDHTRIPDIVVFVNGIPLAVIELKDPANVSATVNGAFKQLETYQAEIPSLFDYNELLVASDGVNAIIGSFTAGREWFKPWRTIESEQPAAAGMLALEVLIRGVFHPERFLSVIQDFVLFEDDSDSDRVNKILAGYHQFHAAKKALEATCEASAEGGNKRAGVVWHTQGSGKSFTMLFFAGLVISDARMNNPTLVMLTDRNDLDDQLFGQFQRCFQVLRQKPVQAESVDDLRKLLRVNSGGVIFTTVHKFAEESGQFPLLTDRRNVVVIADEAHRSQYGFTARKDKNDPTKISYGFAKNIRDGLPNASFIGFTGTPIELDDKNTRAVFGDYVSVYDIQQAVEDRATVPIYYEARVIKLSFDDSALDSIDEDLEELTEQEELETQDKLKTKWSALEMMVGDDDRIRLLASDLAEHFEKRQEAMEGKALIVCMSRRICVALHDALVQLRPDWYSSEDEQGAVKVIMTGSAADGPDWQQHIRTKERRKAMATHFKTPQSPFKVVIVRDMWLTGFDAPCANTIYIDKPMKGHGLMQAIARVNRVYKEKQGGLIVDYLGIGDALKDALKTYTESGGQGQTTIDASEAVQALQHHYELCCDMMHEVDWSI